MQVLNGNECNTRNFTENSITKANDVGLPENTSCCVCRTSHARGNTGGTALDRSVTSRDAETSRGSQPIRMTPCRLRPSVRAGAG